jgi:hypothetical protein
MIFRKAPRKFMAPYWTKNLPELLRAESNLFGFRMNPRAAVWTPQQAIRLIIADDLAFGLIPLKRPAKLHRKIRKDTGGRGDVALFNIRNRFAAGGDCLQQILHVPADRRGDMRLEGWFSLVLGILFKLVSDILVNRFALSGRVPVPSSDAAIQP